MAEALTTEDIKEINNEFYGLAQFLGVDMHDPSTPYSKADVQAVREALEAARIEAQERIDSGEFDKISTRRGSRSPRNPVTVETVLPRILATRHDDIKSLIEKDINLSTVISGADANMTALDALTDTLENSLQTDFYNLGSILGVDMPSHDASNPDEILYNQEKVQEVRDAYSNYLSQAQAIIDTSGQQDPSVTAEVVLTNSLLAAIDNPNQEMANDIYRVVMQAPDSINYLMVKAGGSPAHSPINAPTSQNAPIEQETITKTVALDANGNEVDFDPRIERLEMALAGIVPALNEQSSFFKPKGHTNTPEPGNADGFLDAQSLASYKGAIKHLNYLSTFGKIGSDDPVDSFVPKNAKAIEELLIGKVVKDYNEARKEVKSLKSSNAPEAEIEAAIAEKERLGIMFQKTIPQVMKDIAELHSEGALNAPVEMKTITVTQPVSSFPTTPNPTAPKVKADVNDVNIGAGVGASDNGAGNDRPNDTDAKADAIALNGHIDNVKNVLFALSYKIDEFDAMGLSEAIIDPITQEDMDKEGLGDNFQDLLAKAIVLTKTLGNEGKPADQQDSNPNGVYTKEVGEQLKYAVLTNPALQPVRDILEIDQMSAADAKRYFGAPPAGATPEQIKKHETYQGEVNKKITLLNEFIVSLDAIKANGKIIDEEKARQTTKMNIMLDGMHMAMNKFMPGMSGMLEKFFTNSKFGKMIAGVLSYMGINVNRLWGDKDDTAALERAKSSIEDGFEYFYKDAYKDLGENPSVADVVAKMKENLLNDDGDSLIDKTKKAAIDKVMGVILKGQDDETIDTILTSALDEAAKASTPDAAKEAFSSYIEKAGKQFQDGQNMTIDDLNKSLSETREIAQSPEVKAVVGMQKPASSPAPTASSSAVTPAAVITGHEVDAEYIEFSETVKIGLMLNTDNTKYYQGDLRLSNGRVDDIQAGLAELNLSVITPDMVKIDGRFSDMATPNTSAMIEETLIMAQIHNFKEQNPDKEITQDDLKGFARKLTTENILTYLPMIEAYMEADGASGAAIKAVSEGLNELANDYYSTNLPDDPRQEYSVLDQAFLGNQISLNMLEIGAEAKVATIIPPKELASDSLRDRYLNYDRNGSTNLSKVPCDIPLFYTEEGSDSVFALIRIKSDGKSDSDPYNDTYKILELKDYLNDRSIDDPAILKALQDNYKWGNGNKEGIEAFIDKILCLETLAPAAPTPPPAVEQKQEVSSAFNDKAACNAKVPETFKDLCRVTGAQAAAMAEKGLDVNALFEDYIPITDNGVSTFVIIEPAAFGIEGAEIPDLIVAMRDGDNIDYRAINYNSVDNMKPLSEQRAAGKSDMSQIHNPVGQRRVDDFLDEIERSAGGKVRLSANSANGFAGMNFIAPDGNGGTTLQNGLHYVYGRELFMNTRARAQYSSAYHNRYNERTSYEQVQRDLKHTEGVPHPNVKPVIVNAGQTPADKQPEPKAEEKSFICRAFGACGDDATDTNDKIKQNAGDIDADASNEDIYNPHNADLLNLARPQSHSAAGRP